MTNLHFTPPTRPLTSKKTYHLFNVESEHLILIDMLRMTFFLMGSGHIPDFVSVDSCRRNFKLEDHQVFFIESLYQRSGINLCNTYEFLYNCLLKNDGYTSYTSFAVDFGINNSFRHTSYCFLGVPFFVQY